MAGGHGLMLKNLGKKSIQTKAKRRMGIGTKLVAICLLISLIPLGAAGFLSYNKAQKALLTSMDHILLSRAQDTAKGLNDWILAMQDDIEGLAQTPPLLTTDEAINKYVMRQVSKSPNYETMFTVNCEGMIDHHSSASGIGLDVSQREYFQEAMKGNAYISDVTISKLSGKPAFYIAAPLKDDFGHGIGALVGAVSLDKITNGILSIEVGARGYAYLIDQKGTFLAHPVQEIVLNEAENAFVTDNDHSKQITQDMVDGKTGNDIDLYKGVSKHLGYAPIEVTGWSIGVNAPNDDELFFKDVKQLRNFLMMLTIIAAIIIFFVAIGFSRKMVAPLKELMQAAEMISEGDLTAAVKVKTHDEVGQLGQVFIKMVDNLRQLINHVGHATESLGASSQQMSASAQQTTSMAEQMTQTVDELAKGATEQATMVEQTSVTINQMAATIQQVAEGAQEANEAGRKAGEASQKGKQAVDKAIETMEEAQRTVKESADATKALGENSKEIGKIVEVITGIADQTNLLALNAAIEAARAGEQGRGFAVVADEVRKLAEESSSAAGQIAQLIAQVQQETDKTVDLMNSGAEVVSEGSSAIMETGKTFDEIITTVDNIAVASAGAAIQLQEMSAGSQQIVAAVDNIANITEESAAGAQQAASATQEQMASIEEIAASSQSLAQMAEELQKQVGKFKM